MSLLPGTRLGPYEILSRSGAGGMGEVFRAKDTRLDRIVAIKTLSPELANNTHLRLRFQREAKAISALSHPNICALYDVGEHDGVDFLVMEYLEGETLAERLGRGPLPLKEALRIAIEICAALERAHREGVVHRDLKPANVMLTPTGAKLLDFGLAKTASAQPTISADAPTVQHADDAPLTAEGTIVGTFQYMAPEQIEGADVDARTDIFSFGAVLYEMITRTRAFRGKTRTSLIAAIVASVPRPMSEIAPVTPPALEHVVQRCLEKEPGERWQSAHDIRLELEWIARTLGTATLANAPRRKMWAWIAAAALVVSAAVAAGFAARRPGVAQPLALQTSILPPKGHGFPELMDTLSVSPDGKYVTFRVENDYRLWVRPLGSNEARPIAGTETGRFPFWSPDSRWIAYFTTDKLQKVTLSGAPPVTLCAVGNGRSGSWNEDGVILFAPHATSGIHQIPAAGGTARPVTQLDPAQQETTHRWPVFLPDGNQFIYFAGAHQETLGSERNAIYLTSLDKPKERTLVTRARSHALYARGHLIFVKEQLLVAQPFNIERRALEGEPFRVAEGLEYDAEYFKGSFASTAAGVLVHRTLTSPPDGRLIWYDGHEAREVVGPPRPYRHVRVSPDGGRVAASIVDRTTGLPDIWIIDLQSGQETRLTTSPADGEEAPTWSPDGRHIAFSRHRGFKSGGDVYVVPADGSGSERLVHRSTFDIFPRTWAKSGLLLVDCSDDSDGTRRDDVMVLSMTAPAPPRRYTATPANESQASFSPDERWVSYVSTDAGGRTNLYASAFPTPGSRVQISSRMIFNSLWFDDGIVIATPDGFFLVPVRMDGNRLVVGAERRIRAVDPSVFTGDSLSSTRHLVAIRSRDSYDQAISVTTEWAQR